MKFVLFFLLCFWSEIDVKSGHYYLVEKSRPGMGLCQKLSLIIGGAKQMRPKIGTFLYKLSLEQITLFGLAAREINIETK